MSTRAPASTKGHVINVQVQIRDDLTQGRSRQELQHAATEGLIINDYINGRLSFGEVTEKLGMEYVDARDWLHDRGIATLRSLPEELKVDTRNNRIALENSLKIKTPA